MSETLKPCPFCGAKASIQRYSSGTGGPKCAVWCDACHVGTSWLHGDDGEERVVAEWNRRTSVAARELDVEAERREPVAWMCVGSVEPEFTADALLAGYWMRKGRTVTPLYEAAPVSTEQAGDAVIQAARKLIKAKGRYHTEQSYKALMAEVQAYNALGDAVQKMDSPNNSPAGADKEPK